MQRYSFTHSFSLSGGEAWSKAAGVPGTLIFPATSNVFMITWHTKIIFTTSYSIKQIEKHSSNCFKKMSVLIMFLVIWVLWSSFGNQLIMSFLFTCIYLLLTGILIFKWLEGDPSGLKQAEIGRRTIISSYFCIHTRYVFIKITYNWVL